jgi:hypothetical protein
MLRINANKMNQIIFIITLLISMQLKSQKITVTVLDSVSKLPIVGASIFSNTNTYSTDDFGNVNIDAATVEVLAIGYKQKTISVNNFTSNLMTVLLQKSNSKLSDVIIHASKRNSYLSIINDADIHLRPITNAQEVLRIVPGLFIGQHAGGGKSEQIFLRGFDIDHGTDINITVDDMPVNMPSHAHGQGYADLHFLIPELIDNVKFNKGPYFADKGNFNTAGFVGFSTKKVLEHNFIKLEGGQFNTARLVSGIHLIKNKKNQNLFIANESSFTKGYFESAQNFKRVNSIIKYHAIFNKQTAITATASYFDSKWLASGQIPDRTVNDGTIGFFGAIDNTEGGNTSRLNLNTEIVHKFNNNMQLNSNVYYSKYKFNLYSNFTFFKIDSVNGDQINQFENRDLLGFNTKLTKQNKLFAKGGELQIGTQFRYDIVKDNTLNRTANRYTILEALKKGDVNEANVTAFASQKVNVTKALELNGGVRLDYFDNKYTDALINEKMHSNAAIVSPKLNLKYKLNKNTELYMYTGKGFHSNDTRVAVLQGTAKTLPAAFGSDFGIIKNVSNKLVIQAAFWYLKMQQEFVYVGDEAIVELSGRSKRIGIDMNVRYELSNNLFLDANIALAKPRFIDEAKGENYVPLAPTFTSVGGIVYKNNYGLNGSLRYRLMGNRTANETQSLIAKGYFITDATLNYTTKKWEIGLQIQNLTNSKWKETQFETESKLRNENTATSEIHFTPGTPFFARACFSLFF